MQQGKADSTVVSELHSFPSDLLLFIGVNLKEIERKSTVGMGWDLRPEVARFIGSFVLFI